MGRFFIAEPNNAPVRRGHLQERHVLGRLDGAGHLHGRQEPRHQPVRSQRTDARRHGSQGIQLDLLFLNPLAC